MKNWNHKIIFLIISLCLIFNYSHFAYADDTPSMEIDKAKPNIDLATDPASLTTNIVTLIFVIGIALAFFFLLFGAISWITAGSDKGKIEDARNKIVFSLIGLLILASTWAIFVLVTKIAFGDDLEKITIPKLNETSGST